MVSFMLTLPFFACLTLSQLARKLFYETIIMALKSTTLGAVIRWSSVACFTNILDEII